MSEVFRFWTEKKDGFQAEAQRLLDDIRGFLGLRAERVRIFHIYDIQVPDGAPDGEAAAALSDPVTDTLWREDGPEFSADTQVFAYEALPGQFEQRAEVCAQSLQFHWGGPRPPVRYVRAVAVSGMGADGLERLKRHLINPVESREVSLDKPAALDAVFDPPAPVPLCADFRELDDAGLAAFSREYDLAMDTADARCLRDYMRSEGRDPTLAEVRVLDTYWSDHCRHTTFLTRLTDLRIEDPRAAAAFERCRAARGGDGKVTLMRIATAGMKALKAAGKLPNLDESEEVNACTVKVRLEKENGPDEDWLLYFKNETHNHPTEIEPFGGAATCLGGAIRDPLSGRAYVYQAMRVTGAWDPRKPLSDTLPGKLPQRVLTTTAAAGYSSYANQIGAAAGHIVEIYHPGYLAKRMELGAVVAAAPASNVVREVPAPGDAVVLLGGRTGRDGIGGATGSSKGQTQSSAAVCAAQVQKGDAPEERKIVRLFLDPEVTRMIKRCNDFGAGGVAVAVGELADGLDIDLSKVPAKYGGMSGLELAISESQERMAVVIAANDIPRFAEKAAAENLEATVIATVTAEPRMRMRFQGETVVDLSRRFLSSNGAEKTAKVRIPAAGTVPKHTWETAATLAEGWLLLASDLNICSQRGLAERFDTTAGASTVLMPYGGASMQTPAQVMAALLPAKDAKTASVMSFGFDPYLSEADPLGGAVYAVVTSAAKLVAAGVDLETAYLTFQEYFPRPGADPDRWGLPAAALLGAFDAQMGLGLASVGGKDSMSGTYEDLDVPPALVSFAVGLARAGDVLTPEFKSPGNPVYLLAAPPKEDGLPDYAALRRVWAQFHALRREGRVLSAWALETGGVSGAIIKMMLGNRIGFAFDDAFEGFFDVPWGGLLVECNGPVGGDAVPVGHTQEKPELTQKRAQAPLDSLSAAWNAPLESVFPTRAKTSVQEAAPPVITGAARHDPYRGAAVRGKPLAVIPALPGTNGELDTARAIELAGGRAEVALVRNLKPEWIGESAAHLCKTLDSAHILVLPGGFALESEPGGGCAGYTASFFQNPRVMEAVRGLLARGGLILGLGSGFQALLRLGLLPYGDFRENSGLTLTLNRIGRHQSRYVYTRVASARSPWLSECRPGQVYRVPVSHSEGRFAAAPEQLERLRDGGQIAQQYCDAAGSPSMDGAYNPNGSDWAIEAITCPEGRVMGKMALNERAGPHAAKNIPGDKWQPLFASGVQYFL